MTVYDGFKARGALPIVGPAVAVSERYPPAADATYPGNTTFHTVNDTPANVSNRRLWLKAAKLTLAVALDLANEPPQ